MPDGNCHYLSEAHCLAAGGLSWDQGTACEPNPCPRWGACCVAGDCVPDQTKEDCLSMGGQWAGLDTVCDEDLCVKGVCCVSDICVPGQTVGDCSSVGGEWAGLFTTCFTGICPVCDDGDQDRDGDIDLVDFAELQTCFGCVDCGGDECKCLDINNDNTVTLDDFASFQQALTGP